MAERINCCYYYKLEDENIFSCYNEEMTWYNVVTN